MNTSSNGARFIACREALATAAYHDGDNLDGTPKYSLGFGSQTDKPQAGDTISIEDAFAKLKADISMRDEIINRTIEVSITQQEHDAVASLFYQSGTRALRTVGGLFNEGKPVLALGAFMQFNKDQGIASAGLTKRRIREMIMGIDGWYGDLSQVAFFDGNPRIVTRQFMPFPEDI